MKFSFSSAAIGVVCMFLPMAWFNLQKEKTTTRIDDEALLKKARIVELKARTDFESASQTQKDTLLIIPINACSRLHNDMSYYIKRGKLKVERSETIKPK